MLTLSSVLVARRTESGSWEKVGVGAMTSNGFTFPLQAVQSEGEWNTLEAAAHWLMGERGTGVNWVDLAIGYRVSLFDAKARQ